MFAEVPLYPTAASTFAEEVDSHFQFLLGVWVFFTVLIAMLIIYFSARYRRGVHAPRGTGIHHPLALELAWTLIPLGLVLFIFVWGARIYVTWAEPSDDAHQVYVVGRQWMWHLQHASGQREINQLHVPAGRPVKLTLISQDVIHSFFCPEFRLHMDVLPNRYTNAWFQATRPGRYHLFCSQYCGTYHSQMVGEVIVMEPDAFQRWLGQGADNSAAAAGGKLFQKLQCVSCHGAEARRAPLLENLYRTTVPLEGGGSVIADKAYLRESILYPDAKVVAGYKSIMPSF